MDIWMGLYISIYISMHIYIYIYIHIYPIHMDTCRHMSIHVHKDMTFSKVQMQGWKYWF